MELDESTFLTSDYTTKPQPSRQYGMAQKQKYRPMEQDRKSLNKPMHLWVSYFSQGRHEYTMGQRQPLHKRGWESWTATCKRMKLEHFPNTIHKNRLKMDQRPKCKTRNYKTLRGKHRQSTR